MFVIFVIVLRSFTNGLALKVVPPRRRRKMTYNYDNVNNINTINGSNNNKLNDSLKDLPRSDLHDHGSPVRLLDEKSAPASNSRALIDFFDEIFTPEEIAEFDDLMPNADESEQQMLIPPDLEVGLSKDSGPVIYPPKEITSQAEAFSYVEYINIKRELKQENEEIVLVIYNAMKALEIRRLWNFEMGGMRMPRPSIESLIYRVTCVAALNHIHAGIQRALRTEAYGQSLISKISDFVADMKFSFARRIRTNPFFGLSQLDHYLLLISFSNIPTEALLLASNHRCGHPLQRRRYQEEVIISLVNTITSSANPVGWSLYRDKNRIFLQILASNIIESLMETNDVINNYDHSLPLFIQLRKRVNEDIQTWIGRFEDDDDSLTWSAGQISVITTLGNTQPNDNNFGNNSECYTLERSAMVEVARVLFRHQILKILLIYVHPILCEDEWEVVFTLPIWLDMCCRTREKIRLKDYVLFHKSRLEALETRNRIRYSSDTSSYDSDSEPWFSDESD